MRVLLSRFKRNVGVLEQAAAAAIILVSSIQFGASVTEGHRRGTAIAFLIFVVAICWQRSVVRRRAGRDATQAVAGFAAMVAMLLKRDTVAPEHAAGGLSRQIRGDQKQASAEPPGDVVKVKTLFISDAHLGTRGCQAERLLEFLRCHDAETLFLVGDIIDGWRLNSGWYWPKAHNDVVLELVHQACSGKRLVYVAGNHDECLRTYAASYVGGVEVVDRAIHTGIDGRDYLIIHGDHFDVVVRHARWLALVGDLAYRAALTSNAGLNGIRRRLGLAYWSFSAWAKSSVKKAVNHIGCFEEVLSDEAKRSDVQGVICGHIHHAVMHDDFGVRYINTGDWVESCSGVVEHYDGRFELIQWMGARLRRAPVETPRPLAEVAA